MAQAIRLLVDGGVWDVEKANEELDSEEVTQRVILKNAQEEKNKMISNTMMNNQNSETEPAEKLGQDPNRALDRLTNINKVTNDSVTE